jgi:hypothetical protein
MKTMWTLMAIITAVALTTSVDVSARSLPTGDTYTWSGELVGVDAAGQTATIKSRVVGDQALNTLPQFAAGDRIILTWSGYDAFADAIARVARYNGTAKWSAPFTMPVEFVAYEASRQYVTFKIEVPGGSIEPLRSLKAGEWVTVTSRHRPANEAEAITAVHAYVMSSPRATTD